MVLTEDTKAIKVLSETIANIIHNKIFTLDEKINTIAKQVEHIDNNEDTLNKLSIKNYYKKNESDNRYLYKIDYNNILNDSKTYTDTLLQENDSNYNNLFDELKDEISSLNSHIGNLSELTTTNKSSIVLAINELKTIIDSIDGGGGNSDYGNYTNNYIITATTLKANVSNYSLSSQ